jgi:hypothetical protein
MTEITNIPTVILNLDSIQQIMINCVSCLQPTPKYGKNVKYCLSCKNDKRRESSRIYKASHKEHVSQYNKKYNREHKEEISTYNHNYNIENREAINAYRKDREQNDPVFRMRLSIAQRMHKLLKHDKYSYETIETLGCSYEIFKQWIIFQSTESITLGNYGSYWHLDHVIPCAKFDLSKDDEIKKCFHWTNLQPLEATRNVSKGNKTNLMEQVLQELKIKVFLKNVKNNNYTIIDYDRSQYLK